ncbi:MAG: class I SAM-dependent methyltransferase [Candidatus Omnitrophota bacterium]|jgi:SAM-dependent methyltransferase
MNINCFMFGMKNLSAEEIKGKRVIEIGACNVNGSLRPLIEQYGPQEYIGVDIAAGQGVDVVCDVTALVSRFGERSFDLVVSTELLEHVRDWRLAIHNMKTICKPGGVILVTTRSEGFVYHGYPFDFWRYEEEDMRTIFQDCHIDKLECDVQPGVLLKCVKPQEFHEQDLRKLSLYSIVTRRRINDLRDADLRSGRFKRLIFKQRLKEFLHKNIDRI